MALVNNATTIGTGGKNLVLETAGHIYVKVNERYYELDFKNSGSDKLYGKPIVNEIIQPVEEVDLSDYITNEDLKKTLKKYVTEKSWQDVMDTQSALQNSLLDFEEAIKPITVQTMQVVVGSEELQFDWIYDFTHTRQLDNSPVDSPLYIDMDESSEHYNQLVWNPGFIKHYTIDGPSKVMPETSPDDRLKDYWRWYIMNSEGKNELEEIYMDGTFYVYLKVPYSNEYSPNNEDIPGSGLYGANLYLNEEGAPQQMLGSGKYAKTGIGQVVYSSEAIKFGPEYDDVTGLNYYYLLYAIVTDSDGSPSISTLNGFTEILPGQIRAYIFATADGTQYLDFLHERFKIGNESEFLSWDGGNLNIKGSISVTGGDLKNELKNLQAQIDDEIQCWFSTDGAENSYDLPLPNGDNKSSEPNWPVSTWDNYKEHLGDLYYVVDDNPNTSESEKGQAYRYVKDKDSYYWVRVQDNSVSLALYNAYLAKKAADNAMNKFTEWANDGVISPLEVTDIETEYNFIISDYQEQLDKANTFKLAETSEWISYNTAYTNYTKSLKDILDWWDSVKGDSERITETYTIPNDFKTNLENYYNSRLAFIKLALKSSDLSYIAAAIKKGKTTINGGLVLTGLIELGFGLTDPDDENYYNSFRVMSGINGILKQEENGTYNYRDPAAWFGGDMLDIENEEDLLKPNIYTLYVKENGTEYNKYLSSNDTITANFYKWTKNSESEPYYSTTKNGDPFINNSFVIEQSYNSKSTFTAKLNAKLTGKTFTSSENTEETISGRILAYRTGQVNISFSAIDLENNTTISVPRDFFDQYIVKIHVPGRTINLEGKTILVSSDNFLFFNINNTYYRISFEGTPVDNVRGLVYTRTSTEGDTIVDVYTDKGYEPLILYKWECNDNYIYTLTDYNTKPDYIYLPLSSGGYAKFADNYTVEDHSNNIAKSMFRMDGSGYLANGNISWDKGGKLVFGKDSESIIIDPNGAVKLGYLHSDESSFWIGTESKKMLEVVGDTCKINGSLLVKSDSYFNDNSFISVEDSKGVTIADIGCRPLSTDAIPTYLRQDDNVSVFDAKGSAMWGKVNIPNNWEYQIIDWYKCWIDKEIYNITDLNIDYEFRRVSKAITMTIVLRDFDLLNNATTDTPLFTQTFKVSNSTQKAIITEANLTPKSITMTKLHSYSLVMKLSPGQVQSSIKSDSRIRIERGRCEVEVTRINAPMQKGTFIRPNGISSVFGQKSKFQWLGAMMPNSYLTDYDDYRDQGGTFIVTLPAVEGGDTATKIFGLEITGFMDANGNSSDNPGIRINLGDGWYKLQFDENHFLKGV